VHAAVAVLAERHLLRLPRGRHLCIHLHIRLPQCLQRSPSCHRRVAFGGAAAAGLLQVGHHCLAPSPGSVAMCALAKEGAVATRPLSRRWMPLPRTLIGERGEPLPSSQWFSLFHLIPC
jgi:hypothetical protein